MPSSSAAVSAFAVNAAISGRAIITGVRMPRRTGGTAGGARR
jgi:hypothetical protein